MLNNKIINNAKWIIGCKIAQSLIQLAIGMLSARYLGPTNYGLIDYAASLVAFAVPIMQLGLSSTLVQEYIAEPEREGQIAGTQLALNVICSLACIAGVGMFAVAANPGEPTTVVVCLLYSISLLFQACDMIQYWFQAKLLSKYYAISLLCSYVVVSAYKIWLLITGKSVYWFALSHTVEYCVMGILLYVAYHNHGTQKIGFSLLLAKKMIGKSKHYIVATLMVVLFQRIAGILITQLIGRTENGYFAAAITCNGVTGFVINAIIDTARPVILESRKVSHADFEKNVSRLYSLMTWMGLAQSVGFTVFAPLMVRILYGVDYLPAIPVLQILAWNTAFSCMGAVRNIWILGEEKHNILWVINLCGAMASIVLNWLLIPLWGARGAAVASVLVQILANVIMGFILKPIRRNNYLLLKGLNPKLLHDMTKMLKS